MLLLLFAKDKTFQNNNFCLIALESKEEEDGRKYKTRGTQNEIVDNDETTKQNKTTETTESKEWDRTKEMMICSIKRPFAGTKPHYSIFFHYMRTREAIRITHPASR